MITEINGFKVTYLDEGEGQPVLLLHGWGSSIDVWVHIINYLKSKNKYRIIALDFPGCSKSSLPDNPLNLDDYINLVISFIKKLDVENPIILGHSHGGRVTLNMLGKKSINAKKVVLFGSAGIKSKNTPKKVIKIASFKTVKFFLTLPILKNYTAETLNAARRHFGSSDYNSAPDVMRKTLVSVLNTDVSNLLKNIDVPTLLIWGSNDTAVPLSDAKKMERLIPNAGLCILDGCSHFAFLERVNHVNLILDNFL